MSHRFAPLAAILALSGIATLTFAQQQHPNRATGQPATKTGTPPIPTPPAHDPSVVSLSQEAWKLDSVGLTMFLPLDTVAQASTAGSKSSVQIVPKDATWLINIHTPQTTNPDTTPAELCDQMVTEYFKAAGELYIRQDPKGTIPTGPQLAGVKGTLLELRKTITINKLNSERVYFSTPGANSKDPTIVRGLTVFKTGNAQFVIFELVTTETAFPKVRALYETTVATASFEDPTKIRLNRAAAVSAGRKVLEETPTDSFKAVIMATPERWERCYRPAPSGADMDATEIGYRRIIAKIGPRGQMEQGKVAGGSGSNQEGYIIQMDARMLSQGYVLDTSAAYFLSLDHNEEVWTIRNATRTEKDPRPATIMETGGRTGMSMFVRIEGSGKGSKDIRPVFQSDGYISRVESTLLPQLLIRKGVTADFGFYSYQSDQFTVCYRQDTLEQPSDRPGLWRLTTKLTDKSPAMVTLYNAKGELIQTTTVDGVVWEPIKPEALAKLWAAKHLPMDKQPVPKR